MFVFLPGVININHNLFNNAPTFAVFTQYTHKMKNVNINVPTKKSLRGGGDFLQLLGIKFTLTSQTSSFYKQFYSNKNPRKH